MRTVVETPTYLKAASSLFTEAERADLSKAEQNALVKMAKSFFANYRGKA